MRSTKELLASGERAMTRPISVSTSGNCVRLQLTVGDREITRNLSDGSLMLNLSVHPQDAHQLGHMLALAAIDAHVNGLMVAERETLQ